jgi:hypothetical protein
LWLLLLLSQVEVGGGRGSVAVVVELLGLWDVGGGGPTDVGAAGGVGVLALAVSACWFRSFCCCCYCCCCGELAAVRAGWLCLLLCCFRYFLSFCICLCIFLCIILFAIHLYLGQLVELGEQLVELVGLAGGLGCRGGWRG